jgi:hypothetical protein
VRKRTHGLDAWTSNEAARIRTRISQLELSSFRFLGLRRGYDPFDLALPPTGFLGVRIVRTSLFFVSVLVLSSSSTWANTISSTATVPMTATSWSTSVNLQRFDPALGTLTGVFVAVEVHGGGSVQIESQDTVAVHLTTHVVLPTQVLRPNNSLLVGTDPSGEYVDQAAPFDGIVDFSGPSGFWHTPFDPLATTNVQLTSIADRELFTGPSGNPGTIALPVSSMESISVTAVGGSLGSTFFGTLHDTLTSSAQVNVTYVYTPGVGAPFCAGDGSGTACPCGNSSPAGASQGCTNSLGVGASLTASGAPDVFNDTLVLHCSGLPSTTSALLFQGTNRENGGSGTVFGDGLRCVGGTVQRLGTAHATAGVAAWPVPGAPTLSAAGGAQSGQLLHYQVWYRNAAPFCTPATFNLSQGLSIAWVL